MTLSLIAAHFLFAVALFYIVNWIGRHAISAGYLSLSLFAKADEAPAFNFVFRVLAPVVYLFLLGTALYAVNRDDLVHQLYWVTIYYVAIRWFYNVAAERATLMNWKLQLVVAAVTIALSYEAYDRLIRYRKNILPDLSTISNELWIIILLFLYTTANSVVVEPIAARRRRIRYIRERYLRFKTQFGDIIEREAPDREFQVLVYAVLIYEAFNRPRIARIIESYVLFPLGRSHTLGVMQVESKRRISDRESVTLGIRKLLTTRESAAARLRRRLGDDFGGVDITRISEEYALKKYNIRSDYLGEIEDLKQLLIEKFYPDMLPKNPYDLDDEDDELAA